MLLGVNFQGMWTKCCGSKDCMIWIYKCARHGNEDLAKPSRTAIVKMLSITLLVVSSLSLVYGHFLLTYPPSIGFEDSREGKGPCGDFPIVFNNMTTPSVNITVGSFPIEVQNTHPQAAWLLRATLSHQAPFNWTNLLPVVSETGIGQFCVPDLGEFAGFPGIIQVVQEYESQLLYQVSETGLTAPLTSNTTLCRITDGNSSAITSLMSSMTATCSRNLTAGKISSNTPNTTASLKSGAGRRTEFPVVHLTSLIFAILQ